jgi:hypothetical protein
MPRGPLAVAVPVAPPSVRRSLGGSHCSYKGAAALASARQTPSNRTEPPPAPLRAAAASSELKPTASQIKPPFTAPSPYRNYRAAPPVVPGLNLAGAGRTAAAAAARLRRDPHRPDFGQIRPLATPAPPHDRPRRRPSPEFGRSRAGQSRGSHCKGPSFSEAQSAKQGYICKNLKLSGPLLQKCN